jgi:uncharacterized protein (DUF58 family)
VVSGYLDPKTLSKVERLDLRAKLVVEGFISGMHRSPYRGFSVEFAQHREYSPGDDIKHIDWRVYARNERYYIKQYEEETNLVAHVLLDTSESMAYGSPAAAKGPEGATLSKLEYGKLITAALSYFILGQSDAVAVGLFDSEIVDYIERSTSGAHIHRICEALEDLDPEAKSDMGSVFHEFAERIQRRGIVVVVSDLFDDVDNVLRGLQHFRFSGNEVIVFHLLDEFELTFPFQGLIKFRGLEGEGERLCHPRMLKKAYLDELGKYLTRMKIACRRNDVDYVQINTKTPVDVVLAAYLASRNRAVQTRRGAVVRGRGTSR